MKKIKMQKSRELWCEKKKMNWEYDVFIEIFKKLKL